jgi:hypothetical protein
MKTSFTKMSSKQTEEQKSKKSETLKFQPNPKPKTDWPSKPTYSITQNPLFEQLKDSKSVLLCGKFFINSKIRMWGWV